MRATKADKLIILILFTLTIFSYNVNSHLNQSGENALLYIDGSLAYKIALSSDKEYEITVPNGEAVINVTDGKLFITSAPCPRKICVNGSPISKRGESLICVPNRMFIKIDGKEERGLDSVTK
jgi:hypothetical protein